MRKTTYNTSDCQIKVGRLSIFGGDAKSNHILVIFAQSDFGLSFFYLPNHLQEQTLDVIAQIKKAAQYGEQLFGAEEEGLLYDPFLVESCTEKQTSNVRLCENSKGIAGLLDLVYRLLDLLDRPVRFQPSPKALLKT